MKRTIKRLLAVVLAAAALLVLPSPVFAVGYDGTTKSIIFDGDDNLFGSFSDVMPGDTLSQTIVFKVETDPEMNTTLYMRAEPVDDDRAMTALLSQLSMRVLQEDKVIFDASPDQLGGLAENVELGYFETSGSAKLTIELKVPETLSSAYAGQTGLVRWVFTVDEVSKSESGKIETKDETGDVMADFSGMSRMLPFGFESDHLAVVNLSLTVLCLLVSIILVIGHLKTRVVIDKDRANVKRRRSSLFSWMPTIGAVLLLLMTENFRGRIVAVDKWTPVMLVFPAISGLIAYRMRLLKTGTPSAETGSAPSAADPGTEQNDEA